MRLSWMMTRRQWNDAMVRAAPVGTDACQDRYVPSSDRRARSLGWVEARRMGAALVSESAAYLGGTYAETCASQGKDVPRWAWTNLLAHGSVEDLRRQAQALDRGLLHTRAWLAARAYLATEVLDLVDRGAPLLALQHDVLVPLELGLMARAVVELSVLDWVLRVRAVLAASDAVADHDGASRSA
jgi:hypothetical protein